MQINPLNSAYTTAAQSASIGSPTALTSSVGQSQPGLTDGAVIMPEPPTPRLPTEPKTTAFNVGEYVLMRINQALADIEHAKLPRTPPSTDRTPPSGHP